ncbi:tetratricopeptide repeat protein [Micromonospora sp. NBC_01699]|uniref:AfsR/SARP family transcriptional regulator n=1 Tax=Micromonospora sp. NBC_01699 TaxID=2975984 RepID=UPI002E28D91C|nr:BTAD domain-containing putative transcriptional regulator [Micromonospora sp. NBC_01699]
MEVELGRGRLELAGSREQRILAILLLDTGQVVPVSRLVEALWDDRPPPSAVKAVRNCVSSLRARLAGVAGATGTADLIVTESSGYVLRVLDDDVDLRVFAERVRQGRLLAADGNLTDAVTQLRQALALWRGRAFSGVTGRLIEMSAARLDEQRSTVQEECLSHELRLGHGAELVDELAALVAAEPLRERARGQLMLALHRAGRRPEALDAYQRMRRLLVHELGIEPGPELTELHQAILKGDRRLGALTAMTPVPRAAPGQPARLPAHPVPGQLPAQPYAFTGRTAQLDELRGLLDAATRSGTTALVMLSGAAGVGKTALAVHFARRVADRFPDGQLYIDLRGYHPSGAVLDSGEAVRGFLDAFAVAPGQLPAGLAAQSALLRTLLAGRRVLMVLDNARDAEHVRPLLPGGPGCLTLITSRSHLTGLIATEGAHPLTLGLLSAGEARELLIRRLGPTRVAAEPEAVAAIVAHCAGLSLALAIMAARAASHPTFPLAAIADELDAARGGLDAFAGMDASTDARSVFSSSYRALSEPAARMFRLLSLHPGPDVDLSAAAGLAGHPPQGARPLLAELADTNLISEHSPGRYAVHDLLRAYAGERVRGEESESARLEATRRMFDHYLHGAHAADVRLHPHRDPIDLPDPADGVTAPEVSDRDAAWAWLSVEHSVLLNLVRQAVSDGHDSHAWRLGWALTTFLDRRGHWHEQAIVQRAALQAARRLRNRDAQARAFRNLSVADLRLGQDDEARAHLRHALRLYRQLGDRVGQARTLLNLGTVAERGRRPRLALRYAEQALALFQAAGHRSGQGNALNNVGWYHIQLGDHDRALRYCREALPLQQETGNRYWEAHTWDSLGYAHHHLGQYPEATECYQRALALWQEVGERYYEAISRAHLGDTSLVGGEPEKARTSWRRALEILIELGHPDAERIRTKLVG